MRLAMNDNLLRNECKVLSRCKKYWLTLSFRVRLIRVRLVCLQLC